MMSSQRNAAKQLLVYYLQLLARRSGQALEPDQILEIESIVDLIASAAHVEGMAKAQSRLMRRDGKY